MSRMPSLSKGTNKVYMPGRWGQGWPCLMDRTERSLGHVAPKHLQGTYLDVGGYELSHVPHWSFVSTTYTTVCPSLWPAHTGPTCLVT